MAEHSTGAKELRLVIERDEAELGSLRRQLEELPKRIEILAATVERLRTVLAEIHGENGKIERRRLPRGFDRVERRTEAMVHALEGGNLAVVDLIDAVSEKLGERVNRLRVYDTLRRRQDLFRRVKRGRWALKKEATHET